MQPMMLTQQQPTNPTVLATFSLPTSLRKPATANEHILLSEGQQVFHGPTSSGDTFLVTSGEVLILRNGRPVDLVEAGELLEKNLWPDASAVALTICTLEKLESPVPRVQPC